MTWSLLARLVVAWLVLVGGTCTLIIASTAAVSRLRDDLTIRRQTRVLQAEITAVLAEEASR